MRYILLFIHALTISIYSLFLADPVTVKTNFPASAKPGSEFTAEITINKGQLAGFSKFQLELPQGLTAREGDSKGGSFSLTGQTAKIIWTSVPSSAEFTITMTILVDASAAGEKIITGKYSYIDNNTKQQAEIQPVTVSVASDAVATSAAPKDTTAAPEGIAAVSASRNIVVGSQGEYEVVVKLKKDGLKGFAKLQERIPAGFTAVGGSTDESSFSFSEQENMAKFIWTSLPAREELTLSYKLTPKKDVVPPSPAVLEGEFSYLEEQQSKKYLIAQQELPGTTPAIVTNTVTPDTTPTGTTAVTSATTTPVTTPTTTPVTTETTTAAATTTDITSSQKNNNVYYSVQIGAYRKAMNVEAIASRFSLTGVSTEMHNGLTKFVIGKHDEYKSARDARETVKSKGVSDAFVTAYNLGRRITVQEALMISNQKWFR